MLGTINKDVNGARELWSNSSLLVKLVIVASIFLTLADIVFEWRGFGLQAIELYRGWLVEPLIDSIVAVALWFFFW